MLFIKKFDFKVVTKWLRRKKKVWDELVMKSHLLSIFNFSSWYGQKNCIKTKYIYKKIFYYQKKKQHTIRARNGNIQLCKKIHVCNINQFYWPVMMHERPTQDTWANLVVKSPTTRLNPAKCSLLKSVPTLGSVSITGSCDVPASWQTSMRR